jgi:hypothetical protein
MAKILRITGDGDFDLEVVGESFYQENLVKIAGPIDSNTLFQYDEEKDKEIEVERKLYQAALIPEPANKHDKNAVKVVVQNLQVGYLSREEASNYKKILTALRLPLDTVVVVDAHIVGGYGNKQNYGVYLDFSASPAVAEQLKSISKEQAADATKKNMRAFVIAIGLLIVVCCLCSSAASTMELLGIFPTSTPTLMP